MAGTGAYAIPTKMPLVAQKRLKTKMSSEAKEHFNNLLSSMWNYLKMKFLEKCMLR
jgi:hypothetical protein